MSSINLQDRTPLFGMKTGSGNRRVKTLVLDLIEKHEDSVISREVMMSALRTLATKDKYAEAATEPVPTNVASCLVAANVTLEDGQTIVEVVSEEQKQGAGDLGGWNEVIESSRSAEPPVPAAPAEAAAEEPAPAPTVEAPAAPAASEPTDPDGPAFAEVPLPKSEETKKPSSAWLQPKPDERSLEERVASDIAFLRGWAEERPVVKLQDEKWACGRKSVKIRQDSVLEMIRLGHVRIDGDPKKVGCLLHVKLEV